MTFDRGHFGLSYRWGLMLLFLFELVSIWAFLVPPFSDAAFLIILAATAVLAVVRFELAFLVLLGELFVGSQGGYMVSFGGGSGLYVSVRMGLFLVVMGVWAARLLSATFAGGERRRQAWAWLAVMHRGRTALPLVMLLLVMGFAVIRGIAYGNDLGDVFFDANGYAYFALFPALIEALARPEDRARTLGVLAAAVTMSVAKALFVLFIFSHRMFAIAPTVYTWVRDTRVGEITIMTADYYRVFFQSQIFVLWTAFAALLLAVHAPSLRSRRAATAFAFLCWGAVSMVLSLSRSFWFGAAVGCLGLAALMAWSRAAASVWRRTVGIGLLSVVAAVLIVGAVYSFPYPKKTGDVSLASLLGQRAFSLAGEAAANSRWALLPELVEAGARHPVFGSGLGTTVTYTTSDPRLLADNPTGEYTTYAFEWGYHDLWVKFGLLGMVVYAWLIAAIALPMVRGLYVLRGTLRAPGDAGAEKEKAVLAAGLLIGLLAMLATNVFSPYLNHPLGIGILMITAAFGLHRAFEPGSADGSADARTAPARSA